MLSGIRHPGFATRYLLLALVLGTPGVLQANAEIVRVLPEYRTEASFHRISEFFTGRENTGRKEILRSDPASRTGFYFSVRLKRTDHDALRRGTARVEVSLPDEIEPREYEYPLETVTRRRPMVMLGITGEDWPENMERPLAWRVSFLDENGTPFDAEQSFLWSLEREPLAEEDSE